jgi:hypothetical protein
MYSGIGRSLGTDYFLIADQLARKAIREQKKKERKETRQQRVDALKAKFHKQ